MQPCRVARAIEEAIEVIGLGISALEVRCPPDLHVVADPQYLGEIVTNYLSNASKYGEPPFTVEAWRAEPWVEIRVADRGPGVSPEFVPSLFQPFRRAHRPSSTRVAGAGLGLSIVHELATAHEGEAWYEPVPDGGACFCVRLPGVGRQEADVRG
jgi:signal transduction histidine kinase